MRANELRGFIEQLEQLPALPAVATRLLNGANEGESSPEIVSGLLASDPALASKLLQFANSYHFGMSRQVTTLPMAIDLLGGELVRSIALSTLVLDAVQHESQGGLDFLDLWKHNLSCAIGSQLLAEHFEYPRPEEAFVAGLLHDIGKLVFACWDLAEYQKVIQQGCSTRGLLLELEEEQLGMGHTQAGKLVLDRWRFPASLVNAVWLHHQPNSQFGGEPQQELPFIVKCANSFSHLHRFGDSGNVRADLDSRQFQRLTGLSTNDLSQLSSQIERRLEASWRNFDWEHTTREGCLSAISRANHRLAQSQLQLTMRSRQLEHQQAIVRAIGLLQESLLPRTTCSRALAAVLSPLGSTTGACRMMAFVFLEKQEIIEGCLQLEASSPPEWITLPYTLPSGEQAGQLTSRRQYALIEKTILESPLDPQRIHNLQDCLGSGDLLVLPLVSSSGLLGQVFVELTGSEWSRPQSVDLLRQYAREAASSLERVLLVETLDQQAENLAQLVRREQEAQMRLSQAQQLASVGRLAAGAAHEINNPLAAMSLQTELLLEKATVEEDRTALNMLLEQASRISKIIGDLMGLARPVPLNVQATDITDILDRTLDVLKNRIHLSGISIQQDYQVAQPLVSADPLQLEQVFLNLIINAVQAMPMGGKLKLTTRRHGGSNLRVEVTDTGVGIESEHLPSIFDPFYTTKTSGEGAGLGLSICYSILRNHGGQIDLHSEPGQGTTFSVLLPLIESKAERCSDGMPMSQVNCPTENTTEPQSVLIVEDEAPVARLLEEFLSSKGYQVTTASDGPEGLRLLERCSPDVVILDLRLPHKNGISVLNELRKRGDHQPVIVISGVADEGVFKSARQAGANVCIRKPFRVEDILKAVQRVYQEAPGKTPPIT